MFTNFSPRRHVNDFKGTYFVEKINIYQIKNSFVFTSKDPRIEEFISSAAHFNKAAIFQSSFDFLQKLRVCCHSLSAKSKSFDSRILHQTTNTSIGNKHFVTK